MTSAAPHLVARRPDPDTVVVIVRLPLRELTLLYAMAYLAHACGTRVTSTDPTSVDAATVLHRATCRLYDALRNATVRSGL